MIRERVDVFGHVRAMEPKEEIPALRMPRGEIGVIKEAPVKRWLAGQEMWDTKFKRTAGKAIKRRQYYEAKAERLMKNARVQGFRSQQDMTRPGMERDPSSRSVASSAVGEIDPNRRWGM